MYYKASLELALANKHLSDLLLIKDSPKALLELSEAHSTSEGDILDLIDIMASLQLDEMFCPHSVESLIAASRDVAAYRKKIAKDWQEAVL